VNSGAKWAPNAQVIPIPVLLGGKFERRSLDAERRTRTAINRKVIEDPRL